jgi:hypothetical protein
MYVGLEHSHFPSTNKESVFKFVGAESSPNTN